MHRFYFFLIIFAVACTSPKPKIDWSSITHKSKISAYQAKGKIVWKGKKAYQASFEIHLEKDLLELNIYHILRGSLLYLKITPDQIERIDYENETKAIEKNTAQNRKILTGMDIDQEILRSVFLGYELQRDNLFYSTVAGKIQKLEIPQVSYSYEVLFSKWTQQENFDFPTRIQLIGNPLIDQFSSISFIILSQSYQ